MIFTYILWLVIGLILGLLTIGFAHSQIELDLCEEPIWTWKIYLILFFMVLGGPFSLLPLLAVIYVFVKLD